MLLTIFHKPDKSNKEASNTMMDSPAAVDGIYDPERSKGNVSNTSVFVSGFCQSMKNANQYRAGIIEKIKNQLGSHSMDFSKKQ
jgi:hypothetical protein